MRLLLRMSIQWGLFKTRAAEIPEDLTVSEMKSLIDRLFGCPPSIQILKLKRNEMNIRMVDQDALSFYEVANMDQIFIERADTDLKKNTLRGRYLQKLGLGIETISEVDEFDESQENPINYSVEGEKHNKSVAMEKGHLTNTSQLSSDLSNHENLKQSKVLNDFVECMLGEIIHNTASPSIRSLIESVSTETKDSTNSSNGKKESFLRTAFHKKGKHSESPIHKGIVLNRVAIVQEMLENGLDINAENEEGFTPVQIAILCEKVEIFKMFLNHPSFLVNHTSEKGTPLHTAVQNAKLDFIELLLLFGANPSVRDNKGFSALEICDSEETMKFLDFKINQKESLFKKMPPRPFICSGFLWKTGLFFGSKQKVFLVVDPNEKHISSYSSKEDYPRNPL